jgi:hypothetical protein
MTTATLSSIECLRFGGETDRAKQALNHLGTYAGSGMSVVHTQAYQGQSDILLLWGPGAPNRWPPMLAQRQAGRHVLCLDLAYWNRVRKVRVSIDRPHPDETWVMRKQWPSSRLQADGIVCRNDWNPIGRIVVAGIGDKAKMQYGPQVDLWEAQMLTECRTRWPEREIVYRPKPRVPETHIEAILKGASLVITWHSNVAVDAIRQGIPVVCMDGAAHAVCPDTLTDEPQPLDPDVRDRFLSNLAWFQWNPNTEAVAFWRWAQELLS